ncbi:signal recognition particle-docking protein FtsY [Aggregatibacter actinomycetemcomitans]|uniref:signal recognition particle-docking protein FtsY n=1 Tax=Aggregatibacter actinomycetemcomitans TaxID=714 RepID=UPI00023FFEDA|nr:signal recognition particle-docking protein FtsY [Aggregatibacter actinomycetemcomitans]EHK91575.1 cell division protein FtsY [Aggregatibacter actinomycetemcomitans RhAA1]KNE78585.1 cell division protein FtsY [Aggregatibacter actinomycetemcomitans RhAA1]MBN6079147.1 signal recognition particle-docking protein FtsY [Aggregatibacter actinomycetemcomitans]
MSDEKKKGGFWSWFGLGKNKQEEPEEPQEQAPQEETNQHVQEPQPETQETMEKTTALPDAAETENTLTEDTSEEASVDVGSESNQVIEETLENSTALLDEEAEAQAESAVEISDEFHEHQEESAVADMVETQEKPSEGGFFSRLLKGLVKTKQNIGAGFRSFFLGKKIDDDLFEELEEQLLIADIGVPTTTKIINNLTQHASRQQLQNADSLYQQLKLEMGEILKPVAQPLHIDGSKKPYVILMVGVNGVGKTTTIGKLARKFQMEGKSVMLAAGDTFRAAAVEQLQVWGERNHIPVVAQSTGSDSASVIFDAMQSAAARNIDILIADTAGRLQNKNNLMDELKKIVRVMKKYDESAPHEIMLTLDAGTGQNAISQAKLFHEAVGLTGISLTKLDGTAKGGVIFAIADQFNLPIRYIGVGEKIEDLREFNAEEFIAALFAHEED